VVYGVRAPVAAEEFFEITNHAIEVTLIRQITSSELIQRWAELFFANSPREEWYDRYTTTNLDARL
jgi:hypothetical protein